MTVRQTCLSACGLPGLLLLLIAIAVMPTRAQEVPRVLSQDIPPNAWQVELIDPVPNSMQAIDANIAIRAVAKEAFYFPDLLKFRLEYQQPDKSWQDFTLSTGGTSAEYQTGGQYTAILNLSGWNNGGYFPKHWRLKAVSVKDGETKAETPWRYFTIYNPATAADLYPATFEPTPKMIDGQKRWYFVWTVRNKGNAIAPPSKLHVTCQTEDGSNCVGGIAGTYSIPQLWPKRGPNDPTGAHKVWNDPPVALPPGAKLGFRATIDTGSNPDIPMNNTVVREFVADATPFISPQELRRAAALESQASEAAGTIDDPIVNTLSDGTQTLLLGRWNSNSFARRRNQDITPPGRAR